MPRVRNLLCCLLACAASAALATSASAYTLGDLTEGFSVETGGILFSDFDVKLKGLGFHDEITAHEVVFEDGAMRLELAGGFAGKKGKLKLHYVVSAPSGLTMSNLEATGFDVFARNKFKKAGKLKLKFKQKDRRLGMITEAMGLPLDLQESLKVKSKVKAVDGATVIHGYTASEAPIATPEPGTAAMLGLGLVGFAIAGRHGPR